MSRIIAIPVLLLLSVLPGRSRATVFEYGLPELVGGPDTLRTTTFIYDGPRGSVRGMYLEVSGHVDRLGLLECEVSAAESDTVNWELQIWSGVEDLDQIWFYYGGSIRLREIGPFDRPVYLQSKDEARIVSEGDLFEVQFMFEPYDTWRPCIPISAPPTGRVAAVSIVLDISPLTVADNTTWGRIKGLYRAHN